MARGSDRVAIPEGVYVTSKALSAAIERETGVRMYVQRLASLRKSKPWLPDPLRVGRIDIWPEEAVPAFVDAARQLSKPGGYAPAGCARLEEGSRC